MSGGSTPQRNSFHETLLGLQYPSGPAADIFSEACVKAYAESSPVDFGYVFTQVFEPGVLREIAALEGVPYESLAGLGHRPTPALRHLAGLVLDPAELTVAELVHAASALVSVSRFDAADGLLDAAAERAVVSRERFEIAWLRFLVSNRRDDGRRSEAAFAAMRAEADAGGIPPGRVLDACTQAVVWYLKRREVSEELFSWAAGKGRQLVEESGRRLDAGTVSSWFRGLAMLPAARGQASTTRRCMERARVAAEEKIAESPGPFAKNAIKTYYESSLKERMYLDRDFDGAEEAGRALVALDPVWAPSYGELAEVYERSGRPEQSAEFYERAVSVGPPYVGYHLARAARSRTALGHHERALEHYGALAALAPGDQRVRDAARELFDKVPPAARRSFERAAAAGRGTGPGEGATPVGGVA